MRARDLVAWASSMPLEAVPRWMPLDADDRQLMLAELKREMPPGHPLENQPLIPLMRRRDRDELLVGLVGGAGPLWVIHLTWQVEVEPSWPRFKTFPDFAAFTEAEGEGESTP